MCPQKTSILYHVLIHPWCYLCGDGIIKNLIFERSKKGWAVEGEDERDIWSNQSDEDDYNQQ